MAFLSNLNSQNTQIQKHNALLQNFTFFYPQPPIYYETDAQRLEEQNKVILPQSPQSKSKPKQN